MLNWLWKNQDWMVSGIGVSGVAWLIGRLLSTPSRDNNQKRSPKQSPVQEHRAQIAKWRAMITDVHNQQVLSARLGRPVSATKLLEAHRDFPTLRSYLTEETKQVLLGRTLLVPPEQSTMDGRLHAVLKDIDRLEEVWGVRHHSASGQRP